MKCPFCWEVTVACRTRRNLEPGQRVDVSGTRWFLRRDAGEGFTRGQVVDVTRRARDTWRIAKPKPKRAPTGWQQEVLDVAPSTVAQLDGGVVAEVRVAGLDGVFRLERSYGEGSQVPIHPSASRAVGDPDLVVKVKWEHVAPLEACTSGKERRW